MKVTPLAIREVLLIEPVAYGDDRGFFTEVWRDERYREAGIPGPFVQDNLSYSRRGVLRGLHYQWPRVQGKLVSAFHGSVFDVAVDVRNGSPTFGRWVGEELSAENHRQLWVPPGFAHGFAVLSESAVVHYKTTAPYTRDDEVTLAWNDPEFKIDWPVSAPILTVRDAVAPPIATLAHGRRPTFAPTP